MTTIDCPFCKTNLEYDENDFMCPNPYCKKTDGCFGNGEIWDLLVNTKKKLDIAVDALKRLEKELYFNNAKQTGHIADSVMSIPSIALEQITALEQKDVK